MAIITTDYKIAAGWNNAGGLTAITALTDANGVAFVEPEGLDNQTRGERLVQSNGVVDRRGFPSAIWTSNLLIAQWEYVATNYEGLVTVRLALSGTSFANYNAILDMQDFNEMDKVSYAADGTNADFFGTGWRAGRWAFTGLEAL